MLLAQFEAADFVEFCDCGCNSFKVQTRPGERPPPFAQSGSYGAVFEADFRIEADEKTIEVILFSGEDGNLAYVEIDCCGNSYPVPDVLELAEAPFHVHSSDTIVR
jgi:hypothetical protein